MSHSELINHDEVLFPATTSLPELSAASNQSGRKKDVKLVAAPGGLSYVDGNPPVLFHRLPLPPMPGPVSGRHTRQSSPGSKEINIHFRLAHLDTASKRAASGL
jgi:hypothetical protein